MRFLRVFLAVLLVVALGNVGVLLFAFETVPDHHGQEKQFDVLIVLGTPAKADGSPSPELRERIDEGVREYHAGVAPHLIMTGAAAHNHFVEGQVMADYAAGEGVPRSAILVEDKAKDTVQNIWFSHAIMQSNGWHSAEVISSPYHLPRTALILQHYTGPLAFDWHTHPAHWPVEYSLSQKVQKDFHEAVGCVRLRLHGFKHSQYLPVT